VEALLIVGGVYVAIGLLLSLWVYKAQVKMGVEPDIASRNASRRILKWPAELYRGFIGL